MNERTFFFFTNRYQDENSMAFKEEGQIANGSYCAGLFVVQKSFH